MTFLFFFIGASIASFIQVLITDTHAGHVSIHRRSSCDSCHHFLKWWHLVPLFSYLLLKGKCAFCHKKIAKGTVVFEAIAGLTFSFSYITEKPLLWFIWLIIGLYLSLEDYHYKEIFFFATVAMHLFLLLFALMNKQPLYPLSLFYCLLLFLFFSIFLKEKMGNGDWLVLLFWSLLLPFSDLLKLFLYSCFFALPFAFFKREGIPFLPFLTLALLFLQFF